MTSVRMYLRALLSKVALSRRGERRLVREYCVRGRELEGLLHSISLVAEVRSNANGVRGRRIIVGSLLSRVTCRLSIVPRRREVSLGVSFEREMIIGNGRSLVKSVFEGLARGTVSCSRNGAVCVALTRGARSSYEVVFRSSKRNISRDGLPELFREFCEISGKHSEDGKKAKLNLTVIGRTILFRKNAVDIAGHPRKKLEFRFGLGGWFCVDTLWGEGLFWCRGGI